MIKRLFSLPHAMNCLATLDPSLMFLERLLMLENGHVAVFRKSMQIRVCPCAPEQNPASTTASARPPYNLRSDTFAFHAARISRSRAPLVSLSRKHSTISWLLIIERQNNWRIFEHILRTFQPRKLESHASSLDTVGFSLPYVTNHLATLDSNLVFFNR